MKYFFSVVLLYIFYTTSCQNYTRDAGLRFGHGFMGNYRQFYREDMAVEIIAGIRDKGFTAIALKEHFLPIFQDRTDNINFYYGYGIHAGVTYTNKYQIFWREYHHDYVFSPIFGIDGILGLEYYIPEFPILFSADFRPYMEFALQKFVNIRMFELSFSVKYRF